MDVRDAKPMPLTRSELRRALKRANSSGHLDSFTIAQVEATVDEGFRNENSGDLTPGKEPPPGLNSEELAYNVILEGAKNDVYRVAMDGDGNHYFIDTHSHERVY